MRPRVSDPSERSWPSRQRPPKLTFSLRLSIQVASALALMVSTNLLKVVLITVAAVMEHVTYWVNLLGIAIFYTAIGVYAYLSFAQKQKKAAAPAPAAEAGPAPTEKTKLVSP